MRISVAPHCTQVWVTSSIDAVGVACGRDGGNLHPLSAMRAWEEETRQTRWGNVRVRHRSLSVPRPPASTAAIPRRIYESVNKYLCNAQIMCIARWPPPGTSPASQPAPLATWTRLRRRPPAQTARTTVAAGAPTLTTLVSFNGADVRRILAEDKKAEVGLRDGALEPRTGGGELPGARQPVAHLVQASAEARVIGNRLIYRDGVPYRISPRHTAEFDVQRENSSL
jgi:hypothetical protein